VQNDGADWWNEDERVAEQTDVQIIVATGLCTYDEIPHQYERAPCAAARRPTGRPGADHRAELELHAHQHRRAADAATGTDVLDGCPRPRWDEAEAAASGAVTRSSPGGDMSRADVEFPAEGTTLRGWFYLPDSGPGPFPTVVLQHGFSAVKEMHLDDYAEVFAAAGLACLVYDHPGFGASDDAPGTPRYEIDPWQQIRCISHAITYAQSRDDVDPRRIGLWGSSYGAANAYVAAAIDRRVRAVVGQVPLVTGSLSFTQLVRIDNWAATEEMFAADRLARMKGEPPAMVPVVDDEPMAPSALPTADSFEFFTTTAEKRAPSWRNEVTLRSLEFFRGYEPVDYIPRISPTPLLMVVAPGDRLVDGGLALRAYQTAVHPKKLVTVEGGHFDAYTGAGFGASSGAARDWFVEHLVDRGAG
jgi:fermentation-respiration switch protein FrsA (DUF1100 family)